MNDSPPDGIFVALIIIILFAIVGSLINENANLDNEEDMFTVNCPICETEIKDVVHIGTNNFGDTYLEYHCSECNADFYIKREK